MMHVISSSEMARDSTLARDRTLVVVSEKSGTPTTNSIAGPPVTEDINQQILELRKEQEFQKQKLWQAFQEKNKELELQHKLQLEHKLQYVAYLQYGVFQELREQKLAEEQQQRERRERDALRQQKEKPQTCSANASTEVKQKLQSFLMQKKQAAASNGLSMTNSSPYRNWGVIKSSSGESLPNSGVAAAGSHPYKIPQPQNVIVKYDSDYPLRKTASEPNLLKIRLKQSVIERKARAGPLGSKRHERILLAAQRRLQKHHNQQISSANSTAESSPTSPPIMGSRNSPTSAPIAEENEDQPYGAGSRANINDLSLFSSPSMPNISLGRSHFLNAHNASQMALLAQLHSNSTHSIPGTNSSAVSAGPQPYNLPPLELTELPPGVIMSPGSTASGGPPPIVPSHLTASQLAAAVAANQRHALSIYGHPQPITDAQVAQARLYKQGHRPLGRTQSAPLPLGHPMLTGAIQLQMNPTHYENSEAERQAYDAQLLLKQRIRPSPFNRSGSNHTLKEEESNEAIDLTDKNSAPRSVITNSVITSSGSSSITDDEDAKMRDQEYLQQQREILIHNSLAQQMQTANSEDLSQYHSTPHLIRPLSRTLSSPLVVSPQQLHQPLPPPSLHNHHSRSSEGTSEPPVNLSISASKSPDHLTSSSSSSSSKSTTGLAFDNLMLKHACICGDNSSHPEHSGRLQSVWARLVETGLAMRCDRLRARKATQEELQVVHTETHSTLFGASQINRQKLEASRVSFVRLACGGVGVDLDTTWNEHHTGAAARMAAGCVIDLAFKVARGELKNAFAVVRPPGHHAEPNAAMGFCFFNSVAIAARLLKQRLPEMRRIMIVDWDVHHGNGTQQIFYDDPDILYLSIHRHDDGNFFPGTGGPTECGVAQGMGFNVNIPWSSGLNPPMGDAEYLAAFRTIVLPIGRDFAPDIILVSAGFDAAIGHPAPLGGYVVSPACFGHLTRQLMQLANGKVILALEGGYDLPAICDSAQECVKALLGDEIAPILDSELRRPPCQSAVETLQKTIAIQMNHWPCVKQFAHTVMLSTLEALSSERDESETVNAMAGLSMQPPSRTTKISTEEPMDQDDSKQIKKILLTQAFKKNISLTTAPQNKTKQKSD
uniref:Histone deacetylase n=1 Tax=Culicoides sonorensis TaxID=179676 RepID=A0A336M1A6_CULSO